MPDALSITGAEKLSQLGRDLQRLGDKELQRDLRRELSHETKDLREVVQQSARDLLPGGLGAWVADLGVVTRVYLSGRNVGVRVMGTKNKAATARHRVAGVAARRGISKKAARQLVESRNVVVGEGLADLNAIDRGKGRHPTYGRRPWQLQALPPGFFTLPMHGVVARRAQKACIRVIDQFAARIRRAA